MNNAKIFAPKGRDSIQNELSNFGRHLVYSEGTSTEPFYIEDIKVCISKKYKCNPNEIELIPVNKEGISRNTIGLVRYAEKDVLSRIKNKEKIDHVWIFFDKDEFQESDFISAHKRIINKNNSKSYKNIDGFEFDKRSGISWHSCWSNECFELWLYLYFNFQSSALNRGQYKNKINQIPQLKKIKFNYDKNLKNIHTTFINNGGSLERAIKNAKRLNTENGLRNPSTGVYQFAEYFISYLDLK